MIGPREQRQKISNPAMFGKVAVLFGGASSEREVSLKTGRAVHEALAARGVDAVLWDPAERGIEGLHEDGIDRAWIALHGTGGEDGAIQGALQWLQIPYTGSGVMASALAMDKERSKRLFAAAGIPTPAYEIVRSKAEAVQVAGEMGFPLIFKPSREGSSVGMSKAFDESDVADRDAAGFLRLPREVRVGPHEVSLSRHDVRHSGGEVRRSLAARFRTARLQRLGPGRFHGRW